ncbi:alpha-ketoglutarate-dependent dioxygenase AlkB [Sorangium sp. So ce118]
MTLPLLAQTTTEYFDLYGGGRMVLHRRWLARSQTVGLFNLLTFVDGVQWEQRRMCFGGRDVLQPRLTAWWGDAGASYVYSGIRNEPKPWPQWLALLKERVELATGARYNSCLGNLYRDGNDSVALHADDEPELGPEPVIASLSLGASRRFTLRHARAAQIGLTLDDGDLLVMSGTDAARVETWRAEDGERDGAEGEPDVSVGGGAMKARAIRKRLMRGRVVSFWGQRAYFTVRVPMSAYPEPMPPKPSVPGFLDDGGLLVSDDGAKWIRVGEVCSSHEPDRDDGSAHLVEPYEYGFRWWEAVETEKHADGQVSRRDRGEDLARAFSDRKRWIDRWVHGYGHPTGQALADALIDATWPAKTVYAEEVPGALRLTYSVKWRYPDRRREFCAAIAKAFRVAKVCGVDLRWVKNT